MRFTFLAKKNQDGSYSISVPARQLVEIAWVDFYEDAKGRGYQRNETLRETRGRQIHDYFKRCINGGVKPRLFELTGNGRVDQAAEAVTAHFEPLDETDVIGILHIDAPDARWMSMIDGGTRLLGIERALGANTITGDATFDLRLFTDLSVPEEVALFLLINEKQKRVRTDLGVRVVQRYLDEGQLSDEQLRTLNTVVPDVDQWKYEASRIAGRMHNDGDSPWKGLIQMPGDTSPKPIKLQAFWTSLKALLDDKDIKAHVSRMETDGTLGGDRTEFYVKLLKNVWSAISDGNPDARQEPHTNVLWGSIGVNGCHQALAPIVKTILESQKPDLTKARFEQMVKDSVAADYDYWFSRPGTVRSDYPGEKGEATTMTGGSGYNRLADVLEQEWRAALHAAGPRRTIDI